MAKVTVHMYATLREAAGTSRADLEAHDLAGMLDELSSRFGSEFSKIIEAAKLDHDLLVILVNGRNLERRTQWNTKLSEGDEVSLFPPVSGG